MLFFLILLFSVKLPVAYGQQSHHMGTLKDKVSAKKDNLQIEGFTEKPQNSQGQPYQYIRKDSTGFSLDSTKVSKDLELFFSDGIEQTVSGFSSDDITFSSDFFLLEPEPGLPKTNFPKEKMLILPFEKPDLEKFHKNLERPKRKYQVLQNSEKVGNASFKAQRHKSHTVEAYLATSMRSQDFYFLNNSFQAGIYATEKLVFGAGLNRFSTLGVAENSLLFYSSRFLNKNIFFYSEGGRRISRNNEKQVSGTENPFFMRTGLGTDYRILDKVYLRFLTKLPIYENTDFLKWQASNIQVSLGLGMKIY